METEEVCNTSHLGPKYFKIVLGQNTSFLSLIFWTKTGDILCVSKILGGESLEFTQKSVLEAKSCPSRGRRTGRGFPSPRAAPRGSPGHNTLKATRRKGGIWKIYLEIYGKYIWKYMENIFGNIWKIYLETRSLGALRAPTSSLRPFGLALGPSGLLDFVLRALRALRPCDPRNGVVIG